MSSYKSTDYIRPSLARPNTAVTLCLLIALPLLLLGFTWQVIPPLIILLGKGVAMSGLAHLELSQFLAMDVVLSFISKCLFMFLALRRPKSHGLVIALAMMLVSWGVYFWEVGFWSGMVNSEYPFWYEMLACCEAPVAFFLAWQLSRRRLRGLASPAGFVQRVE